MTDFDKSILVGSRAGMEESGELIANPYYKAKYSDIELDALEIDYSKKMLVKVKRWLCLVRDNKEWFSKNNQDAIKREAYNMVKDYI